MEPVVASFVSIFWSHPVIHQWVGIGMLVVSVFTFVACMLKTAPYGRYSSQSQAKNWGPAIPAVLGWVIMECPSPLLVIFFYSTAPMSMTITQTALLALYLLHYLNRTFIFPFRMKNPTPMFVSIAANAFLFNLFNGFLQGFQIASGGYSVEYMKNWNFIVGAMLFLFGWYINYSSDSILRNLRKPGEGRKYKIPFGGAFEYVTAANYFGELIEWSGWALATWSVAGVAFTVFTFSNLAPRARAHHTWYKQTFKDYPTRRRAIIPFIW